MWQGERPRSMLPGLSFLDNPRAVRSAMALATAPGDTVPVSPDLAG